MVKVGLEKELYGGVHIKGGTRNPPKNLLWDRGYAVVIITHHTAELFAEGFNPSRRYPDNVLCQLFICEDIYFLVGPCYEWGQVGDGLSLHIQRSLGYVQMEQREPSDKAIITNMAVVKISGGAT